MRPHTQPLLEKSSVPVPDPTVLTTEALTREVAALKELVETRLDGMDKAMSIFSDNLQRTPTDTDKQIMHLKELLLQRFDVHLEKFNSIAIQFSERDTRAEQTAKDSKVAVDAALQAAKEAVGEQNKSSALAIAKSEGATTKQVDSIGVQINAMVKAFDDKVSDLKDRVNLIDGRTEGSKTTKDDGRAGTMLIISVVMAGIGIIGFGSSFMNRPAPAPQIVYVPAPAASSSPSPTTTTTTTPSPQRGP